MRLIPCRKIREGMELARDVVTGPPGTAGNWVSIVLSRIFFMRGKSTRGTAGFPNWKKLLAPAGSALGASLANISRGQSTASAGGARARQRRAQKRGRYSMLAYRNFPRGKAG